MSYNLNTQLHWLVKYPDYWDNVFPYDNVWEKDEYEEFMTYIFKGILVQDLSQGVGFVLNEEHYDFEDWKEQWTSRGIVEKPPNYVEED